MRALSLIQPWASLVATGRKVTETRSWDTQFRGELAIHASKRWTKEEQHLAGLWGVENPPLGCIIAVARLTFTFPTIDTALHVDVEELDFGNYDVGRFGWRFEDVRALREPVTARGALGLWLLTPELEDRVRAQL